MYPLNLLILCTQYPILVSLNILEWANNNVQRYIKLRAPMDEKLHRDSTVVICGIQDLHTVAFTVVICAIQDLHTVAFKYLSW